MSIELRDLTRNDFEIYQQFYKLANYEGYQTNFHSLYLWNDIYDTKIYISEHYLVTFMHYEDFYFFNVPLTTKEYFKEAMDDILSYCEDYQIPFLMDGILEEQESLLNELYPNRFHFKHSLDSQSYIYDASMNRTLSGKKMQKRRNHFNAFMKLYENRFTYRKLTTQDKEAVSLLFDTWANDKEDRYAIDYEKQGVLRLIEENNLFDYHMACIEIDNKIEAIIIGSKLNHDTIQIHVEKANKEIRGLYVAIFKFFLENEFNDILWVNREEDMGIESLRKAKQQLHPVKMLDQSFAYQKKLPIISKIDNPKDNHLKERWLNTFKEDDEAFYDEFTDKAHLDIYTLTMDYQLVSVLYLRKLDLNHTKKNTYYIEGVSTHHLYEHQGYMKQLLAYVLEKHKDDILFIQAYDWNVYQHFPFEGIINKQLVSLQEPLKTSSTKEIFEGINEDLFAMLYETYTKKYDEAIKRSLPIDIHSYQAIYSKSAYALYTKFNQTMVVTEIIYETKEDAYQLFNELIQRYGFIKVICEEDLLLGETITFAKYTTNNISSNLSIYFNEYI